MKRSMLKYIGLMLFLFLGGRMLSRSDHHVYNGPQLKLQKDLKDKFDIAIRKREGKIKIIRKRKAKGVVVPVPFISKMNFVGLFEFHTFLIPYTQSIHTSYKYCSCLERGPPAV